MNKKVMALILITLLFLGLLCPAARVFATDISDTASSWKEFDAWMTAHKKSGGTLTLTADIRCEQELWSYIRTRNAEPITVNLDNYSLTFTGTAELRAYNFTLRGKGGESSSLKAAAGAGVLYETYGESGLTGENGPVLWQEEGAVLYADSIPDGTAHFAQKPVAESIDEINIVSVESGEDGVSCLPDTVQARVCYQGRSEKKTLPVHWNLDKNALQAFRERYRHTVCGSLDIPSLNEPQCTVVFMDQPLTWTSIKVRVSSGLRYDVFAGFAASAAPPLDVQAQYSFDGENYEAAGETHVETEHDLNFVLTFYEPDYFHYIEQKEEDLIWDTGSHPDLYLRIKWLSSSVGEREYSDVIKISGADFSIIPVTEGNRGGGTGIINPPEASGPKEENDRSEEENSSQESVYGPEEYHKQEDKPAAAENGKQSTPQKPIPVTELRLPFLQRDAGESEQQTQRVEQRSRESEQKVCVKRGEKNETGSGERRIRSVIAGLGTTGAVIAVSFMFFYRKNRRP